MLQLPGALVILLLITNTDIYAQQATGNLTLQLHHRVGERELEPDREYENNFGEQLIISKFRYYISNIEISDTLSRKRYQVSDQYFLVDEKDPDSKVISLQLPSGHYNKISFLLGVDSLKNVSGIQIGALDPLKDMFWTWKSGYVMAKLEGRSSASTLPHHIFEYHIGGFSGAYNVLGRVELPLPAEVDMAPGKKTQIDIAADIDKWFTGIHQLSIAAHPACTVEGQLAKRFSENYLQMFTIQSISPR
jgi:hypothetical protein